MEHWKETSYSYGTYRNPRGNQPSFQHDNRGAPSHQYRAAHRKEQHPYGRPDHHQHQNYLSYHNEPHRHSTTGAQPHQNVRPDQYQHQTYQEPNKYSTTGAQPHLGVYQGIHQSSNTGTYNSSKSTFEGFRSYQHEQRSEAYPQQNQGLGSFQNEQRQSYHELEPNRHLTTGAQPHLGFNKGRPRSSISPYQSAGQEFKSYKHEQSAEAYPCQNRGFGSFQNEQRRQNPKPYQTDNQGFKSYEQSCQGFESFEHEQQSQNLKPSHGDDHSFISTDHEKTMQGIPKVQQQGCMPPQVKEAEKPSNSTDWHEVGIAQIKETGKADGLKSRWDVTGAVPTTSTAVEASVTPATYCADHASKSGDSTDVGNDEQERKKLPNVIKQHQLHRKGDRIVAQAVAKVKYSGLNKKPLSTFRVRIGRTKKLSDVVIIEYFRQFGKCSIAVASNQKARIITFENPTEGQKALDTGEKRRRRKGMSIHKIQGKIIGLQFLDHETDDNPNHHQINFWKMMKDMNPDQHNALIVRYIQAIPDEPILAYFSKYGPCQLYRKQKEVLSSPGWLFFFEAPGAADAVMSAGIIDIQKRIRSRKKIADRGLISGHSISWNTSKRAHRKVWTEPIPGHEQRERCTCKWNTQAGTFQPNQQMTSQHRQEDNNDHKEDYGDVEDDDDDFEYDDGEDDDEVAPTVTPCFPGNCSHHLNGEMVDMSPQLSLPTDESDDSSPRSQEKNMKKEAKRKKQQAYRKRKRAKAQEKKETETNEVDPTKEADSVTEGNVKNEKKRRKQREYRQRKREEKRSKAGPFQPNQQIPSHQEDNDDHEEDFDDEYYDDSDDFEDYDDSGEEEGDEVASTNTSAPSVFQYRRCPCGKD